MQKTRWGEADENSCSQCLYYCTFGHCEVELYHCIISLFRRMLGDEMHSQKAKCVPAQGMEGEDPELDESDPEDKGQPDNEDLAKSVDGSEEEEEISAAEEQREDTEEEEDWHTCSEEEHEEDKETAHSSGDNSFHNSSCLLRKDELLEMFKATHTGPRCKDGQLTVGLVG